MPEPILQVEHLVKHYRVNQGLLRRGSVSLRALDGVSFSLYPGETVGIVGESGCGKSTLARTVMWLEEPTDGSVRFNGEMITNADADRVRRRMQIVFQDPYTSLPPRMTVGNIVADPIRIHDHKSAEQISAEVRRLLTEVGINPDRSRQYPFQFSGGQRQRIGIARALAVDPDVLILDEAVSALDVSVQGQILNLLRDLQDRRGLAFLFISHDLGVVRYVSDRILVMYLGKVVEEGPANAVFEQPRHPYTLALLSAIPAHKRDRRERIRLSGEPPRPTDPPSGCPFHPRCPMAQAVCSVEVPQLLEQSFGHFSACHFADNLT